MANEKLIERADELKCRIIDLENKVKGMNLFVTGIENTEIEPEIIVSMKAEGHGKYSYYLGDYMKYTQKSCLELILYDAKRQLEQAEKELEALLPKESEVEE